MGYYMKKLYILILLLFLFIPEISAYAHAGSLDEYGGHVDHRTEPHTYHYHHGWPAHSHAGGYCEYNFIDATNKGYIGTISQEEYDRQYQHNYNDREQYVPEENYPLKSPSSDSDSNLNKYINSIIEKREKEQQKKKNILAFSLTAGSITVFLCIKKHKSNMDAKKKFEEEKQYYTELYGGRDIFDMVKMPSSAFIDTDGYPHETIKNDDIFVVYVSPKQPRVFHRYKSCGRNLIKKNYIDISFKHLQPCKRCKPPIPDITWYDEYCKIKSIKDKYKIE